MFKNSYFQQSIISILLGGLGAVVVWWIVPKPPVIATVQISQIIDRFVKDTAKRQLPEQEKSQLTAQFAKNLEQALKTVVNKKNLILVPKEAVIKGAKDYTQDVEAMMDKGKHR